MADVTRPDYKRMREGEMLKNGIQTVAPEPQLGHQRKQFLAPEVTLESAVERYGKALPGTDHRQRSAKKAAAARWVRNSRGQEG